jgi:hypothetical protein
MFLVPVLAVLLLIFDPGPPPSPVDSGSEFVDCHAIFPGPIVVDQSSISFRISIGEFIHYPESAAVGMLNIVNRVGNFVFQYRLDSFMNITQHEHNISFVVRQQMAGLTDSMIFCHDQLLLQSQFRINAVDHFPLGFSYAYAFGHMAARLSRFCFINGKIHFFTDVNSSAAPIVSAFNRSIPLLFVSFSAHPCAPGCEVYSEPVAFISATPRTLWRQLVDVLVPLWGSIYESKGSAPLRPFLLLNQTYLLKNLNRIISVPPIFAETNGCFADGHFLAAPGSHPFDQPDPGPRSELQALVDHIHLVSGVNPAIIPRLRDRYTNKVMKNGRIVVDRLASGRVRTIERLFPGMDVVILPETDDLHVVADVIAEAQVFVTCHISTIVFGVFMHPGASMLEIQPDRLECTAFGARWANMGRSKYIPARIAESCECHFTNLTCYLEHETVYEGLTEERFQDALERALE